MTRKQAVAAWTLVFLFLTAICVWWETDSISLAIASVSALMTIAGSMELYQ